MDIGDVVYLKSGGVPMTVISVDGENIGVNWMNNGQPLSNIYPAVALTPTDPAPAIKKAADQAAADVAAEVTPLQLAQA